MRVPSSTLLYAAFGLVAVGLAVVGGSAGFLLGGWAGALAGMGAASGAMLLGARITIALCRLQTKALLGDLVMGDVKAEAIADAVLRGVALYEASVFPLTAGGTSSEERLARRAIAYRLAAFDDVAVTVRLTAAEALEAIDHGRDADRARDAVRALNQAVLACRTGHAGIRDEQTS
ncbi:hypothetical protein [Streptomyces sp. NPDC005573]|uniref:hypothetical protein n=1 Tax=Streptomyces sp. NPDC005573 TaxID=3156890 RepID=UPI0033BDF53B